MSDAISAVSISRGCTFDISMPPSQGRAERCAERRASEVALLLLLLHRARRVEVDDATLGLGSRGQQHLSDDPGEGVGLALHRAGQRVTAERAEANLFHHRD